MPRIPPHTALVLHGLEANRALRLLRDDLARFSGQLEQKARRCLAVDPWSVEVCGENRAPFGRDQLHIHLVALEPKPHRVRIELRLFRPPGCCSRSGLRIDVAAEGKKNGLPVIAQPGTELMRAAKSVDSAIARLEHPGSGSARLQCPVRHPEGHGGNWKCIAAGKVRRLIRSLQQVHHFRPAARRGS